MASLRNITYIAWFEMHENAELAIKREKQIKKWKRQWKLDLIEKCNPLWEDLYESICSENKAGFLLPQE
jgi:putative endonuclease